MLGGYAGLVSLGHSAFFGTGALVTRVLWISGVPIVIALLIGGIASITASLIIGVPSLRLKGAYFSMGTLALTIILYIITSSIFIDQSFLPQDYIASYSILPRYFLGVAIVIASLLAVYWFTHSRRGIGIIAIRENEDVARTLGINVFEGKVVALAISAFFAGISGGFFAYHQVSYYYYYPFSALWSFEPILVTFIGGIGTAIGPVIGALFYVIVREVFVVTLGKAHIIVFSLLFILVVLLLPGGLVEAWDKLGKTLRKGGTRSESQGAPLA